MKLLLIGTQCIICSILFLCEHYQAKRVSLDEQCMSHSVVTAPLLHNSVSPRSWERGELILIRLKPSLSRPRSDFRLGREGDTTMELRPTMGTGERQHRLSILDRCHPSKMRSSQVDTENRGTASVSSRCFHCIGFNTITE